MSTARKRISVQDYLQRERQATFKSEFFQGEFFQGEFFQGEIFARAKSLPGPVVQHLAA